MSYFTSGSPERGGTKSKQTTTGLVCDTQVKREILK